MPGMPVSFFILALVAVGAAVGMLVSRNAVYSVLFLVLNFITIAMIYLILGAPFIALSQITVYAGSIMVLFLFVIMLLGAERLLPSENLRWQPYLAIPLAIILVAVLGVNFFGRVGPLTPTPEISATYGAPNEIGELLFTGYILPFETTGLILLVAVIGSIILAKPDRLSPGQEVRRRNPAMPAPAGAASSASRETPAAEQEKALKS